MSSAIEQISRALQAQPTTNHGALANFANRTTRTLEEMAGQIADLQQVLTMQQGSFQSEIEALRSAQAASKKTIEELQKTNTTLTKELADCKKELKDTNKKIQDESDKTEQDIEAARQAAENAASNARLDALRTAERIADNARASAFMQDMSRLHGSTVGRYGW